MTSEAFLYVIHINWCVFFAAPYISLAALKIVAFLQLPALELIFNAIRVVLILALKINVLREITFNFTLFGTT